jgi:hypothetical protein
MLVALAPWWFEKCLGPVLDARRKNESLDEDEKNNGDESSKRNKRKRVADADALARRRARQGVLFATALVTAAAWGPVAYLQ